MTFLFFLSDILLLLGATTVTASFLGRFSYRGRQIFDLNELQRFLAFILGTGMLVGCILLNAYANEVILVQSALLTPTP